MTEAVRGKEISGHLVSGQFCFNLVKKKRKKKIIIKSKVKIIK